MVSKKVLLPEGVQDLLIDDCFYRREIENSLIEDFSRWGYMEVSTPTLEYYDLFSQDYLSRYGDKMFKLIDTNGSLLVLRPDCTIPIARMVATKMKDFVYPLKLSYIQNVFRMDQEQAGKKREFRQAGVELFGVDSPQADAEVIITAIESLINLGLENFQIEVGQITLLEGIFNKLNISEEEMDHLIHSIENKNFIEIEKMLEALDIENLTGNLLKKLPQLFGNPQRVLKELNQLELTAGMQQAVNDLSQVVGIIEAYGYGSYISLDMGMVSHLGYYTGIIFKGFTKDLGVVLLSGGRYDRLLEDFGMKCPATGFAFILNKITKALKIQEKPWKERKKHVLIVGDDQKQEQVAQLLKGLRADGNTAELCHLKDTAAIEDYCRRRKVDEIWYLEIDGRVSKVTIQGEQ